MKLGVNYLGSFPSEGWLAEGVDGVLKVIHALDVSTAASATASAPAGGAAHCA